MSSMTSAQLATLAAFDEARAYMFNASGPVPRRLLIGTLLQTLADGLTAVDTDLATALTNYGAPVADIAALSAVAAADRSDKQLRVVEDDGFGHRSIYIFDSASSATADGVDIVAPDAGSGRWFRAYDIDAGSLGVINSTGAQIDKGKPVRIVGLDATTGRFKIDVADSTVEGAFAIGVLAADLANAASAALQLDLVLASSGLDTQAGAVGDPVYLNGSALSLAAPTSDRFVQIVGRVATVAASGTLRLRAELPAPGAGDTLRVVNATGGQLDKGKAVQIVGYDAATDRWKIDYATSATDGHYARAILPRNIADTATDDIPTSCVIEGSGLNTSGAAVGDAIYLSTAGAITLSPPTKGSGQLVGRVVTVAADGTIKVDIGPAQPVVSPLFAKIATFAVTVDAETVADHVNIHLQAKDANGDNLAAAVPVKVTLLDAEYDIAPSASATGALAGGGAGSVSGGSGTASIFGVTDAAGVLDLDITDATGGAFTRYARLESGIDSNARLIVPVQAELTWSA